ncbi:hypothetical protein KIN20_011028 [Parelaphostrongylus tenuis]|uniref:Uncharacterized protein n=1 Tax=Parelaphostrongylus tenuis TaxID=148309 RepID=A0AAD5MDF8_PARTN|nr:hypothetical protein KIN20_011028 [Parelaphostrongylus tenuis]
MRFIYYSLDNHYQATADYHVRTNDCGQSTRIIGIEEDKDVEMPTALVLLVEDTHWERHHKRI